MRRSEQLRRKRCSGKRAPELKRKRSCDCAKHTLTKQVYLLHAKHDGCEVPEWGHQRARDVASCRHRPGPQPLAAISICTGDSGSTNRQRDAVAAAHDNSKRQCIMGKWKITVSGVGNNSCCRHAVAVRGGGGGRITQSDCRRESGGGAGDGGAPRSPRPRRLRMPFAATPDRWRWRGHDAISERPKVPDLRFACREACASRRQRNPCYATILVEGANRSDHGPFSFACTDTARKRMFGARGEREVLFLEGGGSVDPQPFAKPLRY